MAVSLAVKTSKGHTLSRMWPAPIGVISGFVWEPAVGFEPTACCLRNSCSAPELRWHRLAVTLIHRRTLARDERPQAVYRTITPSVKRHPSNERHPSRLPRPERQTCAPRTRLHPYEPTRSSLQLPPAPSSSLQLPPAPSSSLIALIIAINQVDWPAPLHSPKRVPSCATAPPLGYAGRNVLTQHGSGWGGRGRHRGTRQPRRVVGVLLSLDGSRPKRCG